MRTRLAGGNEKKDTENLQPRCPGQGSICDLVSLLGPLCIEGRLRDQAVARVVLPAPPLNEDAEHAQKSAEPILVFAFCRAAMPHYSFSVCKIAKRGLPPGRKLSRRI